MRGASDFHNRKAVLNQRKALFDERILVLSSENKVEGLGRGSQERQVIFIVTNHNFVQFLSRGLEDLIAGLVSDARVAGTVLWEVYHAYKPGSRGHLLGNVGSRLSPEDHRSDRGNRAEKRRNFVGVSKLFDRRVEIRKVLPIVGFLLREFGTPAVRRETFEHLRFLLEF